MTDQEKKQLDGFKTENEYLRLKHGVLLTTAQRVEQGLKKFLTSPHLLLTEEHRADLKRLSTISTAHVENIVNNDPTKLIDTNLFVNPSGATYGSLSTKLTDKDGNKVDPNSATALLNPCPVRNQLRSDQLHSEHPDSGKMYQEEMHPDQLLLPLDKDTKGSQKPIGHVEPVAIKS
jgi:hypothetical protein